MLKVRVIPTLLWKGFGLVKGRSFDSSRPVGSVLPAIKVYNAREVDELILLDVSATAENRNPDYDEIDRLTSECFVPLTFGGGIRDLEQIRRLLRSGADKVAINSAAYADPSLVGRAAAAFGSQCVVAGVDARRAGGRYECFSHGGARPTGKEVAAWCRELQERGAGEILLTSIERDGNMTGYETDLIAEVTGAVSIPVIASGGAGNFDHMLEAVRAGASAVAAAALFHFTESTPLEAKKRLAANGIAVRDSRKGARG